MSAIVSKVFGVQCETQGQCLCYITVHYIAADRIFHDFDYGLKNFSQIRSKYKYFLIQLDTITEQIRI